MSLLVNCTIQFEFAQFHWTRPELKAYSPIPRITIYHKWTVLKTIVDTLRAVGGAHLVERFSVGCFGHLLNIRDGPTCGKLLFTLMAYQIRSPNGVDSEFWFVVGGRPIRLSTVEYALVTGLHFGSSSFDPTGRHDPFGFATYTFTGGTRI